MKNLIYLFSILLFFAACSTKPQPAADLILLNAEIWTANPDQPVAQALAVRADTILFVGSPVEAEKLKGAHTQVIDVAGAFVTPGFIDTHVHFLSSGQKLSSVQLRDAKTPEEFIQRIGDFAKTQPEGTWILGGDWDHQNWGGILPHKEWIDSVSQNHFVMLNRLDGHIAILNSKAITKLELSAETPDIHGGEIFKDDKGELTGILTDNAYYFHYNMVPSAPMEINEAAVKAAMAYVAAQGVTSVHDMDGFEAQLVYESLQEKNELATRIYSNVPLTQWQKLAGKVIDQGKGDEWLKIGGLKGFVDGALGSHTAAFYEGYTDTPDEHGFFVNSQEDLYSWIYEADKAGLQVMVHAIGDSANSVILDIYQQVERENGPADRRFRIEHAQHLTEVDIARFANLEVIPVMQPYHAIDDGRWAAKYIGSERIKYTYAFKSLLHAEARLAFGSDWSVAPATPLEGIYAAVTRRTLDGANLDGWVPEQKISLQQALYAYTMAGAYASFEENIKGSIEVGKLADFVVIDQNLFNIDPVTIRDAKVKMTFVGGTQVY